MLLCSVVIWLTAFATANFRDYPPVQAVQRLGVHIDFDAQYLSIILASGLLNPCYYIWIVYVLLISRL